MATFAPVQGAPQRHGLLSAVGRSLGIITTGMIMLVLVAWVIGIALGEREQAATVMSLALPAFLAGALSVLSPCSFPILLGYFAVMFQQRPQRIGLVTLAFLLGVGTTMSVLGASFTALGSWAIDYQETLSRIGGVLIIGFGLMALTGRGFRGMAFTRPGGAGTGAAYAFGLLFALGWTACVGPILGSILTMLLADGASATGAYSLVSGAALAQVYVLGMGLPILILVFGFSGGMSSRDFGRMVNGREITARVGSRTWSINLVTMLSSLLLIGLGWLLLTGTMTRLTQELGSSGFAQWIIQIEERLPY